jgi:hypothetical protein
MSDYSRFRRDDPPRFAPTRHFSNLYRPYHTNPGAQNPSFTGQSGPASPGQNGPGFRPAGVDSAYRVVNRFMAQGQRPSAGPSGPHGPYGNAAYPGGMTDGLQRLVNTAISSYGGMASIMMEMLNCMYGAGGYGGQGGYGGCGPGYFGEWNSPFKPTEMYLCTYVPINLTGKRVSEVFLKLVPHTNLATLDPKDLPLTTFDSSKTLANVAHFEPAAAGATDKTPTLTIILPDPATAPNNQYVAEVSDTSGHCRGSLTLCLW